MKKVLLIRYGAYGDIIHCSMLPRLFKEKGYEVHFEYNFKARQLLAHNPHISQHIVYEPTTDEEIKECKNKKEINEKLQKRYEKYKTKYDKVINLNDSLERGTIAMEDMESYDLSQEERKALYDNNYYDWTLKWAGLGDLVGQGIKGEVYFTENEHAMAKSFIDNHKDKFILLVNLSGTSLHKVYPFMGQVIQRFLDEHEDAIAITTGDQSCQLLEFKHDKIIHKSGVWPFRQSLLVAKYVDGVVGCESGMMVGATMWETRACQLMTAASINCHIPSGQKKDFSIQSKAPCSPCFKGPYTYRGCPSDQILNLPLCVTSFDKDDVLAQLNKMYEDYAQENGIKNDKKSVAYRELNYSRAKLECTLCGATNYEAIRKHNDCIYFECEYCKIFYTYKENMNQKKYDKRYITKYDKFNHLFDAEADKYLPILKQYMPGGKFLEIGPTTDRILEKAEEYGYEPCAIDINPNFESRYPFNIGNFEDYHFCGRRFDVIWLTHVFEHFLDPLNSLSKLTSLLNNRGCIVMAMPDPDQIDWRNPFLWDHWHGDEHYTLWKEQPLVDALNTLGMDTVMVDRERIEGMPVTGDFHVISQRRF